MNPSDKLPGDDDEEYEILDLTTNEVNNDSVATVVMQQISKLSPNTPATEVACGGAGGWIVGYLFKKFGRIAASAVGGGFILLQVANQSGYITVNWRKVNRDVEQAHRRVNRNINANHPKLQSVIYKVKNLLRKNAAVSMGFAGGFFLGMAT